MRFAAIQAWQRQYHVTLLSPVWWAYLASVSKLGSHCAPHGRIYVSRIEHN